MNASELAKMRQDRRKHSVAIVQPVRMLALSSSSTLCCNATRSSPHEEVPIKPTGLTISQRHTLTAPPTVTPVSITRPSAAVPAQNLNIPQTIRFTNPTFTPPKAKRFSSATTLNQPSKAEKRAESVVPPNARAATQQAPRRKSTIASLFWDPLVRVTTGEAPSDDVTANGDPESGSSETQEKSRSFITRCKTDKLMHTVLGMVFLFGGGLIVAGVIWTVTRHSRVVTDSRNFVCGKGIAGGPKCAVHLKGQKSNAGTADWVGGDVVDWWLKNHCIWQGKQEEWLCGTNIGSKEGQGDQVLPQSTWFEKVEDVEEAESGKDV